MPASYAEQASLTCSDCGHTFTADIWLIVDASERPDLVARAREGTLHRVTCPRCGHAWDVDVPLLIFTPPDLGVNRPPVLFSPAQQTSAEQDQEHAAALVTRLRDALGERWRDEWLDQALVMPRLLLFVVLADGIAYGRLGHHLWEYMSAGTPENAQRILEQHPELLSDDADVLLGRLIETARAVGTQHAAPDEDTQRLIQTLEEHRTLLRRCREVGVERAFAALFSPPAADAASPLPTVGREEGAGEQGEGLSIPPEFQEDFRRAKEAEQRYLRTADVSALDEAVAAWERILNHPAFFDVDERFRLAVWNDAGGAYLRRYQAQGQISDLNQALRLCQKAVQNAPSDFPSLPGYLNNLATGLRVRYTRTGNLEDLDKAIRYWQRAVALAPEDHPDLPMYLNNLATGLHDRYARTNNLEDLEAAIRYYQQAVALTFEGNPNLPAMLNNLANGLSDRYTRTGNLGDLETAIRYYRRAVALTPEDHPDLPARLNNLATGLRDRYARTGNLEDLEAAIRYWQRAVDLTPQGHLDRPSRLNNLANSLHARYVRTGNLEDLETAIRYWQQAVDCVPEVNPDLPMYLNNLANGLRDRYARTGNLEDLEAAIRCYRRAVTLTPEDHPDLPARFNNLAAGLSARYARTGNLGDLEMAIRYSQRAVALAPEDHPDLPMYLNNLAAGLRDRYAHTGSLQDLEVARAQYRRACARGLVVTPEVALTAARSWGNWALERAAWVEAIEAYGYGQEAITKLLEEQVGREAKATWLKEVQGLPQQAAYAHAKAGQLQQAVDILESGIARLLREALAQNRRDLERLRHTHPQVYERYQQARGEVARLQTIAPQKRSPDWTEHLRQARQEVRDAVEAIRSIPGFEHFLRPLPWEDITELARNIPLVYLLTTPVGGLALVVHQGNVTSVFLDALDEETVNAWLVALDDKGNVAGGYLPAQITGIGLRNALETLLPRLGHALTPLWDHLLRNTHHALHTTQHASRTTQHVTRTTHPTTPITLIPTGRLVLLPWHAAQHPTTGRAFLDDFVVAYVVSAHTLHHLRLQEGAEPPPTDARLLAVGNPTADLRYAAMEAHSLADLWPGQVTLLLEDKATRDAVWGALARAAVAHFATHGTFNPEDPLQSALFLARGTRLTLRDLMEADPETLAHLRLAVLSACQTAIPDFRNLPDEVIGLPVGFHQAGVPGVVGSLWPVDDVSTALLMVRFYEYWLGQGYEVDAPYPPANALAAAQRWLRDLTYDDLDAYLEHHRRLRERAPAGLRMSYQLISELRPLARRAQYSGKGKERPYRAPYHWAGFVYYGVHPT